MNISSEKCMHILLFSRLVQLFAPPWTAAHQASLSPTISQNLLKLLSLELVMPFLHHQFYTKCIFTPR